MPKLFRFCLTNVLKSVITYPVKRPVRYPDTSGGKKQTFPQETERACRLLMNSCQGYGFVGECNMKSVIHKKRPAQRPAEFREEFKL